MARGLGKGWKLPFNGCIYIYSIKCISVILSGDTVGCTLQTNFTLDSSEVPRRVAFAAALVVPPDWYKTPFCTLQLSCALIRLLCSRSCGYLTFAIQNTERARQHFRGRLRVFDVAQILSLLL